MHRIVKAWVETKDKEVKRLVYPILELLIWSCVKLINEEISIVETEMNVVTLPSKMLKAWRKMRLEGKLASGWKHRGWQHLR